MSKINTNAVKEQAINIMGDLKNLFRYPKNR